MNADGGIDTVSRFEKVLVVFYWGYILVYFCVFAVLAVTGLMGHANAFYFIMPFHFFGMFLGLVMLIVVFRDLYKRDFANPNMKVTWAILMLVFAPAILVYLYKHGFRPRPTTGLPLHAEGVGGIVGPVRETGNPYQSPGS